MHPESMPGKKQAAEPRDVASSPRAKLANERDRKADERDARANERDRKADERDTRANEREVVADDREALADDRDRKADEREARANAREAGLDDRFRALRLEVQTQEQRALELIERSRALLGLSGEHLDRQEAGLERIQAGQVRQEARGEREQADVDRASAEGERTLASQPPNPRELAERASALRKQALSAVQAFALTEEEVARVHEDLAALHPERRDDFLRTAAHARNSAHNARQVWSNLTDNAK